MLKGDEVRFKVLETKYNRFNIINQEKAIEPIIINATCKQELLGPVSWWTWSPALIIRIRPVLLPSPWQCLLFSLYSASRHKRTEQTNQTVYNTLFIITTFKNRKLYTDWLCCCTEDRKPHSETKQVSVTIDYATALIDAWQGKSKKQSQKERRKWEPTRRLNVEMECEDNVSEWIQVIWMCKW